MKQSEKGVTLIEVLVSIVILSIILLTTMRFFPQMGLMNNENTIKSQAINTAKEILLKWQNQENLDEFFTTTDAALIPEYKSTTGDYYNFETTQGDFVATIKIKITPSMKSNLYNAHLIQVNLYKTDKPDTVVSQTYGYVKIRR